MNNIFDFKRFGKYYVADLRHTFDYSALSILLTSFTGVIAYLFFGLMKLIVSGEWMSYGTIGRSITFVIAFYIIVFTVPAKCYGFFTDKRSGSFFTLIPASSLEKTISMIINVCILAPLAYTVISLAADSLICFLDPMAGNSIIQTVTSASGELYDILSTVNDEANFKVLTTGELVSMFCDTWNKSSGQHVTWVSRSENGPHEANYLKLDCSKIKSVLGWKPRWSIQETMNKIVEWSQNWLCGCDPEECMKMTFRQMTEM